MSNPRSLRIFLSYTRKDLGWARWIAGVVEECGHTAVYQEPDSPWGDNFALWIDREIERADLVLPIFSADYFTAPWCTTEWTTALNYRRLIPVQVAPCTMPPILRKITRIKLVGMSEKACRKLLVDGLTEPAGDRSGGQFPPTGQRIQRMQTRWMRSARYATALALFTAGHFQPDPTGQGGGQDDAGAFDGDILF